MKREVDKLTDDELNRYVSLDNPQSFFLMAGAGSGKTRSLVSMLEYLKKNWRSNLKYTGRKIAVITFTKAASEEILARIKNDSAFHISTIHSFAWEMIKHFQCDIKDYLINYYKDKLDSLQEKPPTGRREKDIGKYQLKLEQAQSAIKFYYSPDANITRKGYITHTDVINIMNEFLQVKPTFAKIMTLKYPILLIDECQDTNKKLLTTLIEIEEAHKNFCLGLIGDMMQRVYTGGVEELEKRVNHWANFPKKVMNWRSQKRIVEFLNELRKSTDNLEQYQNKDKDDGVLKIYIIEERKIEECIHMEQRIKQHFLKFIESDANVNTLILEHKMAARRHGFSNVFSALDSASTKITLQDATGKEMKFIREFVLPFINALRSEKEFELLNLFRKEKIVGTRKSQESIQVLKKIKKEIDKIRPKINKQTTLLQAIEYIKQLEIIEIPTAFIDKADAKYINWEVAMNESLNEFEKYFNYKDEHSPYITQQGSKGLEYNHVMVIMNDSEAGGHMFNFSKLTGTKPPSQTDLTNIKTGRDNALERTKRLLYVAASRAKESLALIIYSSNVESTKKYFLQANLVNDCEIVTEKDLYKE